VCEEKVMQMKYRWMLMEALRHKRLSSCTLSSSQLSAVDERKSSSLWISWCQWRHCSRHKSAGARCEIC